MARNGGNSTANLLSRREILQFANEILRPISSFAFVVVDEIGYLRPERTYLSDQMLHVS